ncbi:DUF6765 family protein [Butyrivibrio sp. AE3004]|uniref:DUF6765 family protein n=1 Tax=Butyrivibrio sp. AE3004 TaxID=1506994 RepID=UPI000494B945|nr:DUF6765 family protein [Butyrivibrio sp. AE3004]
MQEDFHYYATYCAAFLAGYTHEESLDVCYSAQLVDLCSKTFLDKIHAPLAYATTQLQLEMMDVRTDILGLQDITRIWASFHFLPYDLYAVKKWRPKIYMDKYRLICRPNSDLVIKTVEIAKGKSLQAVGLAMHVLADTWAHSYFAGTPSLVINNTTWDFREVVMIDGKEQERPIRFRHNPSAPDNLEENIYTNSLFQNSENSVMNLGHGRAGHLPDYSFIKYRYIPAWDDYKEITKDNPNDYLKAFTQMIYAMKYLRGEVDSFEKDTYDMEAIKEYRERIEGIIRKRQLIASNDWKAFGEELSGQSICDFDLGKYQHEYVVNYSKTKTFIGRFLDAAIAQKSMVTNEIFKSKNHIAGFSKEITVD